MADIKLGSNKSAGWITGKFWFRYIINIRTFLLWKYFECTVIWLFLNNLNEWQFCGTNCCAHMESVASDNNEDIV